MNHWIILPILFPAVVAPLLAMSVRHDIVLARIFSVGSTVLLAILAGVAVGVAQQGETLTYSLGNWPAPFGIVLVLDRLAALMLLLTSLLGLCVLLYSISHTDSLGKHFHALFQFQLMGLNGAFLTGDLFNLFVFFEVLLIASYGLMVHGGGPARLRAGIQYVVINLVGSSIFLFALGLIYAATGTLNLADLAQRIPTVPESNRALLVTGETLLMIVFGIKSALFPLHFWLPGTYANTAGPVAALFAIMTKVGIYSILRVHSVAFEGTLGVTDWLLPASAITLVIGVLGVVAAKSLSQQTSFVALGSVGTLLIAVSVFTMGSLSAALYYLIHSTLAVATLFLVVDLVIARRRDVGDALVQSQRFSHMGLVGALFFVAAIACIGMPPLSGFIGKLLIMDGVSTSSAWGMLWGLILVTSLISLIGLSRSGSLVFWKSLETEAVSEMPHHLNRALPIVAVGALIGLLILLTGFSGLITQYLDQVADQMKTPSRYLEAVLASREEVVSP